MVDDADKSILQLRAQLKDKLIGGVNGKLGVMKQTWRAPQKEVRVFIDIWS